MTVVSGVPAVHLLLQQRSAAAGRRPHPPLKLPILPEGGRAPSREYKGRAKVGGAAGSRGSELAGAALAFVTSLAVRLGVWLGAGLMAPTAHTSEHYTQSKG